MELALSWAKYGISLPRFAIGIIVYQFGRVNYITIYTRSSDTKIQAYRI